MENNCHLLDIELVIDTDTKLPIKAQVLENDPLLGDVVYEVIYREWTTINGLQIPKKVEHILDGFTIRTETLNDIEINPTFDATVLTVAEADAWTYDATQARYGHCLLYTSPSPRDATLSRMPSSA